MKVIPIASARVADSCDDEGTGEVPKLSLPLTRRDLLHGSGVLMGTLAAGTVIASLAPSTVWAVELKTLSKAEGETLMKMGRTIYPHKKLPDAVYALLAKDLDADAAASPDTAKQLKEGVAALNKAAGGSFAKASDAKKLEAVKSMESTPFFATVRGKSITSLYNNDMAFAHFGYPGSAWEKGGYITRGFQDLKWLPAPPESASPKPFLG